VNTRRVALFLLLALTGARLTAEERPPQGPLPEAGSLRPSDDRLLTLADLESLALQHHPTLVQAEMLVRAAEGACLQAGLYPNPVAGYRGEEIGDEGKAGQQGGFVSQQIITGHKLQLGRAVASHRVEEARLAWEAQRRRVLNDLRARYYEVLVAQQTVDLDEQLLRIGQEGAQTAEQLFRAQEVGRTDVLQAGIEADTARLQLENARNQFEAAWRQLAVAAGVPHLPLSRLAGSLEADLADLTWEQSLAKLLAESPELARARSAVERARCELDRQCALRQPDVEATAAVQFDNASRDTFASVELGVPLPIFNRNQGNIVRAQADLVAAEKEVERVRLALIDRLSAAFFRYANARRQAVIYAKEILPKAQQSLELTRTGYRQGQFDYLTLLTAQRTYFRTNLQYIQSLRELRLSLVDIEGLLLRGGLQEPAPPAGGAEAPAGPAGSAAPSE